METIEDIVRELRSEPLAYDGAKPWIHYLADRIEAAVHDITAELDCSKAFYYIAIKERDSERLTVNNLLAENAGLKAALNPVLDVKWEYYIGSYCSGTVPCKSCECAVREAQRIYSEGSRHEEN